MHCCHGPQAPPTPQYVDATLGDVEPVPDKRAPDTSAAATSCVRETPASTTAAASAATAPVPAALAAPPVVERAPAAVPQPAAALPPPTTAATAPALFLPARATALSVRPPAAGAAPPPSNRPLPPALLVPAPAPPVPKPALDASAFFSKMRLAHAAAKPAAAAKPPPALRLPGSLGARTPVLAAQLQQHPHQQHTTPQPAAEQKEALVQQQQHGVGAPQVCAARTFCSSRQARPDAACTDPLPRGSCAGTPSGCDAHHARWRGRRRSGGSLRCRCRQHGSRAGRPAAVL